MEMLACLGPVRVTLPSITVPTSGRRIPVDLVTETVGNFDDFDVEAFERI